MLALALFGFVVVLLYWRIKQSLKCPPELESIFTINSWNFLYYGYVARLDPPAFGKKFPEWAQRTLKRFYINGNWIVFATDPEMAREIYTNTEVYPKLLAETLGSKFYGKNIIYSNGADWRFQHSIIAPAFQTKNVIHIANTAFMGCIERLLKFEDGPIEANQWAQRFALDVLGQAGFSYDLGALKDANAEYVSVYNRIMHTLFEPLFLAFPSITKLPLPSIKQLLMDIEKFDGLLLSVIKKKQELRAQALAASFPEAEEQRKESRVDLLDLMLESPEGFTPEALRNNLVIFFFAGHDTTAAGLTTSMYHLAQHPEVQEKARQQVLSVVKDKVPEGGSILDYVATYEDQKSFDYLTAVIKEGLRLFPPIMNLPERLVTKDTELGGHQLSKGTLVTVCLFDLQRDPKVWGEDGNDFIPERFLPPDHPLAASLEKQPTRNDHPYAFNAFGASHRSCIGQQFSMVEQRMLLSTLLLRYELSLPPGYKMECCNTGIMGPKDLVVNLKRRRV